MVQSTASQQKWFTAFFRRGHLLVLSIVIILVAGISAIQTLPRLEDPRIDLRNVSVLTSFPGASAERVEALVTDVLEDELRQLHEIKKLDSSSKAGFSAIAIELQDWTDASVNQQIFAKIRDAIDDAAKRFPQGAQTPVLEDKRGAAAFTILLAMNAATGHTPNLSLQGRLADEIADRLRNVNGTELVRIYGAPEDQITVTIDSYSLVDAGLTIQDISQRVQSADPKLPAGTLIGVEKNIRFQVDEPLSSAALVANIPILAAENSYLRLGDIAQVSQQAQQPEKDIAILNGQRTIFVAVRMQPSIRVDTWTENIKTVMDEFNHRFQGSVSAQIVFEQNKYTEARLNELTNNLLMGCAVVMTVILFFMGLKAAWIVGLALPLCAAFTFFSLSLLNQQIHQMSIFGVIIAIGLLIDNAIVITDEIRINLLKPSFSRLEVLEKSIKHLFSPLLASTLTTILGFMPIFLLNGNIGDFIGPIAISVVMALIASLSISLTIIAALAARFLPRNTEAETKWYQQGIQMPDISAYLRKLLTVAVARPMIVLPLITVFCFSGFGLSSRLDNVFFPSADRDQFEIYIFNPVGSSIQHTFSKTLSIDDYIRKKNGVAQVSWLVGGSTPSVYYNQIMNRDNSPEFANAVVTADSVEQASSLITTLQYELQDAFPEVKVVVRKFGQGPPIKAPIEVDIFGPDIEVLTRLGEEVRLAMTQIDGISNSISSIDQSEAEIALSVDESASLLNHLTLRDIALQLQNLLAGSRSGSVLEDTEELPIVVRVGDITRASPQLTTSLPVLGDTDSSLAALGDWQLVPSTSAITRLNGERLNRVTAYLLPDIPAVSASEALRDKLKQNGFVLPDGYRLKMAGDADEQAQALGKLATYAPVLLVMMITSLILSFSSVRFAIVIGLVAILSVGLGFFSLWLSGLPFGFNPLLGSAGLIGVAINGSIVVIAAIASNHEAMRGEIHALVEEVMGCSRHILSTTFTTVGGLIPLLLFSEGSFWPPLAVVLAGGVGFSVILSLFFTPTLICLLCRLREKRRRIMHNLRNKEAL
ncbi:efflux RND transporter permease subunit [Agaribacter flavus]|uniref:Efflux RND transporter permease subunit n=1 Tax=Agaribacter flavus TaxID=1902781 RepID=A0ABV7FWV7_9ALTE